MLHALSNFDHPDWNLRYAREIVDFDMVLDCCIERFERTATINDPGGENIFTRSSRRLMQIRSHLESKGEQWEARIPTTSGSETFPVQSQSLEYLPFDDDWLRDIMDSYDCQFTGMENQSAVAEGQEASNKDFVSGVPLQSP